VHETHLEAFLSNRINIYATINNIRIGFGHFAYNVLADYGPFGPYQYGMDQGVSYSLLPSFFVFFFFFLFFFFLSFFLRLLLLLFPFRSFLLILRRDSDRPRQGHGGADP
jgi:hypothetical protein